MLDTLRDDNELTLANDGFVAAEFHAQRTFHDEEKFVFGIMVMPDELALELDGLLCAIVDFANDARISVIREAAELFFEINGFHFAPGLKDCARFRPQQ